jgi:hypothetical protein
VRSGPDADAPATPEAQVAIGEPISANLPVSWSTALKPVAPVFQKDQREGSQGAQKGGGEREAARGKPEDEEPLSASVPNARKTNGVNEPARALPPAPSAATAPDSSSSQMAIPVIKRRRNLSEEDLRKDIRLMPEIPSLNALAMNRLVSAQKVEVDFHQYIDHEPNILLKIRPDLKSLPVRKGRSCQLDKRSAANLGVFSQKLHALVDRPTPEESNGQHAMPALFQKFLKEEVRGKGPEWLRPEAIPALQQILMQENQPLRWLLVEILAKIPGPEASVALAQRALYDLSPEVRGSAIQALKDRPRPDYRQVLLNGLRYPWAPIADHAAEALAALGDREVIPILVAYLSEPGPNEPVPSGKNQMVLREMARINHAANCLMCHPPAARLSDPLTAPVPGLFLLGSVPRTTGHYGSIQVNVPTRSGFFVRVDITYLRQDFSIREPIKTPGTDLVTYPRFDFLVRTRKVKSEEAKDLKAKSTSHHQQREAILFALRELTGVNAGSETIAWAKLFPSAKLDDETHGLRPKW